MARQKFEKSFNTFVKGLMTEASEINFPENYSLYEKNFELRRDGGRDRRKGMDLLYPLGVVLTSKPYMIELQDGVSVSSGSVRLDIDQIVVPSEVMGGAAGVGAESRSLSLEEPIIYVDNLGGEVEVGARSTLLSLREPLVDKVLYGGGAVVGATSQGLLLKEVVSNTGEVQPVFTTAYSRLLILEEV